MAVAARLRSLISHGLLGMAAVGVAILGADRLLASAGQGVQPDEFGKGAYLATTPHLVLPKVKEEVRPVYTADALTSRVQGEVNVDVVVLPNGTVGDARLAKLQASNPLHDAYGDTVGISSQVAGLEDAALKAVKTWTFEPGTLNGHVVPVVMTETLFFRIH